MVMVLKVNIDNNDCLLSFEKIKINCARKISANQNYDNIGVKTVV